MQTAPAVVTGIAIRPAVATDVAALLALYRHLHPSDPVIAPEAAQAAWEAMLASPLVTVLVAAAPDAALRASCTLVVVPNLTRGARPYALIENVVTHADHRRQGFGQMVLRAALDRAWSAGCYKVMLATGSQRESTLRFYERAGLTRGGKTFFHARAP